MLIIKNALLYSQLRITVIDAEIKDQFFKLATIWNITIKDMILHSKKRKTNRQKEFLTISFDLFNTNFILKPI